MNLLVVLAYIILLYFFLIFFVSRFFIPHLGFRKDKLPNKIPKSMENEIRKLKHISHSKHELLTKTYDFLSNRYYGARMKTITCVGYLFRDVDWTWEHPGFLPCTQHNFMLRIFLIKSGFFMEKDIKVRHAFYEFDIHQYPQVRLDGKWVDVDLWGHFLGKEIGQHAGL